MLQKIEFFQIQPGDVAFDLGSPEPWTVERVQSTTTLRRADFASIARGTIDQEWIGWSWYREVPDTILPATTAFIPPCYCGKCTDCR